MIRSKGEAGTGNVVEATRHMRQMLGDIRRIQGLGEEELFNTAKELGAPYELVREVHETGKLPVVMFTAGGLATPADAAMMMQLGAEGVFVGSGIFKSGDPAKRANAIVQATLALRQPRRHRQGVAWAGRGDGRDQHRHPAGVRAVRRTGLVTAAAATDAPLIGVLALQGDVREHEQVLQSCGVRTRRVRTPEELVGRRCTGDPRW